jgi:GH25 family lysozyme M1 (1,4-beta-N-acetylmuramidase)
VRIKYNYTGVSGIQYIDIPVTYTNYSTINTQLTDSSGNLLYTDQNATTALTVANFKNTGTYYTAPAYLGWQTIDGKVYYFYATNQKATGDQVINGVKYTFASDGSLSQSAGNIGIDVSKYQGNIDWGAVATAGVSFAIIRVGYRGAQTGALIEDPYFKTNIAGATKAGIKVGLYFFTQAVTEAEAVEEASMCIQKAAGYKISYPIFIDTEGATNGRANGLDRSTRTSIVNAFCATIQASGYKAGVYASKSWYNNNLNASSLSSYTIWGAQYNTSCTYAGRYSLWQYTSKGSIAGISGNVDMNISYLGY